MENSTLTETLSGLDHITRIFFGAQTEVMIFIFAFVIHFLFFGRLRVRTKPRSEPKKGLTVANALAAKPQPRCAHAKELTRQVEYYCELKDAAEVASKLSVKLLGVSSEDTADALAGLLEGAGKSATPQLLAGMREVLQNRGLQPNVEFGELLLRNYFNLRLPADFRQLHRELTAIHGNVPSLDLLSLKVALHNGDLKESLEGIQCLPQIWNKDSPVTPSAGPGALLQQLLRLALQQKNIPRLLERLLEIDLLKDTLDNVLVECVQQGEPADVTTVLQCKEWCGLQFGETAYSALIKNTSSPKDALNLFTEAIRVAKPPAKEIFSAAGEWALANGDKALADAVLKNLPSNPPGEAVGKILRFYGSADKTIAFRMYKDKFQGVGLSADIDAMRLVTQASIEDAKGGRKVLESMLAATCDNTKVSLLKSLAREHDLQAGLLVLWASPDKSACLYNAAIDACIDSRSIEDAKQVMSAAVKDGVADLITYNTIIKAYCHPQIKCNREAREALEDMKAAGFQPNIVTFNELLDGMVKGGSIDKAWNIVSEMRASGVKPNRITCAILLKAVRQGMKSAEIESTIALLDEIEEEVDEILLCSLVDACIRVRRSDLLIPKLKKHRGVCKLRNAHTFGSIIRAYGSVNDVEGVWETWRELLSRNLPPNAVALGCMTDALSNNGETEAAYTLIREMQKDEQWAPFVNVVIYCSVLKGMSQQKRFDRVWTIYNEMLALKLEFTIVTFNTLLDACARHTEMSRIPALLADMESQGIRANIITYGIIVKGYCVESRIDEAFAVVEGMLENTEMRPDEIMFNTLLDGCARLGKYERGLRVLEEMEKAKVGATNYTLSVLVKLANRGRKVDKGFEWCQELSAKYKFRLNVQVYDNLINMCITNKDLDRALGVLEMMLTERVRPDTRSYSLLLKGYILDNQAGEAAGLLRAAAGHRNVHPRLSKYESRQLKPEGGLPNSLITETLEGIAIQCCQEWLAVSLLKELREIPQLKLDPKLQLRLVQRLPLKR